MKTEVTVSASPSLALIKYWGKADIERNTPATPSLAVTLGGLYSETTVRLRCRPPDIVVVDGKPTPTDRYAGFFDELRRRLGTDVVFEAASTNTFPTAAGLASSASGFAALAVACARLLGSDTRDEALSAIARLGSASAARSLYGGFTGLPAGAEQAVQLYGRDHWPEFRVVVVAVTDEKKSLSSREAMERARRTSRWYDTWVSGAEATYRAACDALSRRSLDDLGPLMRSSYLAMFSTMFTSTPPVIYWRPASLELIRMCESLRAAGIGAWETMDAGPQVKIACLEGDLEAVLEEIEARARRFENGDEWQARVAAVGGAPEIVAER